MNSEITIARKRLDSWKEIAEYIGRDVRTAMRWERDGLPVHRIPGGNRRAVFAIAEEIDEWLADRGKAHFAEEKSVIRDGRGRWASLKVLGIVATVPIVVALLLYAGLRPKQTDSELTFKLPGQSFRFVKSSKVSTNGAVGGIFIFDVNRDGWQDLAVGGLPNSRMMLLVNKKGEFEPQVVMKGCYSSRPNVADFDGDGNLDLAISCFDTSQVEVHWGDGRGNFGSPTRLQTGGGPLHCVRGDFNNDGISDLVTDATSGGPLIVVLGNRERKLVRTEIPVGLNPQVPIVIDIDSDGKLDIVTACYSQACREVNLVRGNGDGTFQPFSKVGTNSSPWTLTAGDLTGDGVPDLFAGSITGEQAFLRGLGGGRFAAPTRPMAVQGADMPANINIDGRNYVLDLQYYPGRGRLIAFDHEGNASISPDVDLPDKPRAAVSADFNHDGKNDLAILTMQEASGYVTVYLGSR